MGRPQQVKILAILPLVLLTGCGTLIPKQVEFFQKKVKPVPQITDAGQERLRQGADWVAHNDPTNRVAQAVSGSLGPPSSPYRGEPDKLADKINHDTAKLNEKIEDYTESVAKEVGKKIEGTGLIRIGYFTYIACIIGLVLMVWFGIRVYGLFNPIVGTVSGVVGRVGGGVVQKGFSEVVAGGSQFLHWVDQSNATQDVKDWITNTFKIAQQTQQSADVQVAVDKVVPVVPLANQKPPAPPASITKS